MLNDNCTHTVNGKTVTLSAGNVCLLRPLKDNHFFNIPNDKDTYRHRDIYITDADMKTYCNLFSPALYSELLNAPNAVSFCITSTMCKYIEELFATLNNQSSTITQVSKNIHFAVAINLLTCYETAKLPTSQPDWLNEFVRDLKNPDNFVVSIEELTAKIPYSHGYICKEFKIVL